MNATARWDAAGWAPAPRADELHLWRIDLQPPPAVLARLAGRLAPEERRRAERFRFDRDRRRFHAARGALRELLAGYLGAQPERLSFAEGPHGKPELAGHGGDLRFNLSHSGELALCAVAWRRELGVDLEQVRQLPDAQALARRFFSSRENAALEALPAGERLAAFFRCWTRKEAYLKALGAGLLLPLADFDVSLSPEEGDCSLSSQVHSEQAARWALQSLDVADGYAAAVVAERPAWRNACWSFAREGEPSRARVAGS